MTPKVGEKRGLELEDVGDGWFDIPPRHAITKKIKLEPGRGADPPQLDKSGDIGGRGSGATDASVPALELEHQRGEIAAGWVCGSGLRYLRKRTKVTTEAD